MREDGGAQGDHSVKFVKPHPPPRRVVILMRGTGEGPPRVGQHSSHRPGRKFERLVASGWALSLFRSLVLPHGIDLPEINGHPCPSEQRPRDAHCAPT